MFSPTWMIQSVHFLQILPIHMRIDLRRGDVHMAEHFLYGSEVGAAFEEVGGEGVAEGMGTDFFIDTGEFHIHFQDLPQEINR